MRQILSEWRQFLSEAEAKYSGIIKIKPGPSSLEQIKFLQKQIKDSNAVILPEEAIHVTAIHQSFMKPFRKQLKNMELPPAPEPVLDTKNHIIVKESGDKKSWVVNLENQDEMRNYVKQVMELLGGDNLNPEPGRVFHVSLANLTGNPHDSVR